MALPSTAIPFKQVHDPADVLEYYVCITQGEPDADPPTILLTGEGIASYDLTLTPEAMGVGVQIIESGRYVPELIGNWLRYGIKVDPEMHGASVFDGGGVLIGVEMHVVTTEDREKTHTILHRIANK